MHFIIRRTVLVIFGGLLFFNLIKLFSGFRDTYQFDLADDVKAILSNNENSCFFIQRKEFFRLGGADSSAADRVLPMSDPPFSYDTLTPFYDLYDYIKKDSYFIFSGKGEKANINIPIPDNSHSTFSKIRHYRTNKTTSFNSVYYHPRTTPDLLRCTDEINNPEIKDIVANGLLKAYEPVSDTYVFQLGHDFVWLIGTEVAAGTELVYHIYTDSPELLPPKRISHGFDNQGIYIRNSEDINRIGNYSLFMKAIPANYPVSKVKVGFYIRKSKTGIWSRTFQM